MLVSSQYSNLKGQFIPKVWVPEFLSGGRSHKCLHPVMWCNPPNSQQVIGSKQMNLYGESLLFKCIYAASSISTPNLSQKLCRSNHINSGGKKSPQLQRSNHLNFDLDGSVASEDDHPLSINIVFAGD